MRRPRARRVEQIELFEPPRRLPEWETLPPPSKEEALRLLAQMMRGHLQQTSETSVEGRCADER